MNRFKSLKKSLLYNSSSKSSPDATPDNSRSKILKDENAAEALSTMREPKSPVKQTNVMQQGPVNIATTSTGVGNIGTAAKNYSRRRSSAAFKANDRLMNNRNHHPTRGGTSSRSKVPALIRRESCHTGFFSEITTDINESSSHISISESENDTGTGTTNEDCEQEEENSQQNSKRSMRNLSRARSLSFRSIKSSLGSEPPPPVSTGVNRWGQFETDELRVESWRASAFAISMAAKRYSERDLMPDQQSRSRMDSLHDTNGSKSTLSTKSNDRLDAKNENEISPRSSESQSEKSQIGQIVTLKNINPSPTGTNADERRRTRLDSSSSNEIDIQANNYDGGSNIYRTFDAIDLVSLKDSKNTTSSEVPKQESSRSSKSTADSRASKQESLNDSKHTTASKASKQESSRSRKSAAASKASKQESLKSGKYTTASKVSKQESSRSSKSAAASRVSKQESLKDRKHTTTSKASKQTLSRSSKDDSTENKVSKKFPTLPLSASVASSSSATSSSASPLPPKPAGVRKRTMIPRHALLRLSMDQISDISMNTGMGMGEEMIEDVKEFIEQRRSSQPRHPSALPTMEDNSTCTKETTSTDGYTVSEIALSALSKSRRIKSEINAKSANQKLVANGGITDSHPWNQKNDRRSQFRAIKTNDHGYGEGAQFDTNMLARASALLARRRSLLMESNRTIDCSEISSEREKDFTKNGVEAQPSISLQAEKEISMNDIRLKNDDPDKLEDVSSNNAVEIKYPVPEDAVQSVENDKSDVASNNPICDLSSSLKEDSTTFVDKLLPNEFINDIIEEEPTMNPSLTQLSGFEDDETDSTENDVQPALSEKSPDKADIESVSYQKEEATPVTQETNNILSSSDSSNCSSISTSDDVISLTSQVKKTISHVRQEEKKSHMGDELSNDNPVLEPNGSNDTESIGLIDTEPNGLFDTESNNLIDTESNSLNDIESNSLIDVESNNLTDVESNNLIDIESNSLNDVESNKLNDTKSNNLNDTKSNNLIDIDSNSLINTDSNKLNGIESNNLIDIDSYNLNEINSNNLNDIDSNNLIDIDSNNLIDIDSNNLNDTKSNSLNDIDSSKLIDIDSNSFIEIKPKSLNDTKSHIDSNRLIGIDSNRLNDTESNILNDTESNILNDTKSNRLNDIDSNRLNDIDSNRLNDIDSNRLNDIESNSLIGIESNSLNDIKSDSLIDIKPNSLNDKMSLKQIGTDNEPPNENNVKRGWLFLSYESGLGDETEPKPDIDFISRDPPSSVTGMLTDSMTQKSISSVHNYDQFRELDLQNQNHSVSNNKDSISIASSSPVILARQHTLELLSSVSSLHDENQSQTCRYLGNDEMSTISDLKITQKDDEPFQIEKGRDVEKYDEIQGNDEMILVSNNSDELMSCSSSDAKDSSTTSEPHSSTDHNRGHKQYTSLASIESERREKSLPDEGHTGKLKREEINPAENQTNSDGNCESVHMTPEMQDVPNDTVEKEYFSHLLSKGESISSSIGLHISESEEELSGSELLPSTSKEKNLNHPSTLPPIHSSVELKEMDIDKKMPQKEINKSHDDLLSVDSSTMFEKESHCESIETWDFTAQSVQSDNEMTIDSGEWGKHKDRAPREMHIVHENDKTEKSRPIISSSPTNETISMDEIQDTVNDNNREMEQNNRGRNNEVSGLGVSKSRQIEEKSIALMYEEIAKSSEEIWSRKRSRRNTIDETKNRDESEIKSHDESEIKSHDEDETKSQDDTLPENIGFDNKSMNMQTSHNFHYIPHDVTVNRTDEEEALMPSIEGQRQRDVELGISRDKRSERDMFRGENEYTSLNQNEDRPFSLNIQSCEEKEKPSRSVKIRGYFIFAAVTFSLLFVASLSIGLMSRSERSAPLIIIPSFPISVPTPSPTQITNQPTIAVDDLIKDDGLITPVWNEISSIADLEENHDISAVSMSTLSNGGLRLAIGARKYSDGLDSPRTGVVLLYDMEDGNLEETDDGRDVVWKKVATLKGERGDDEFGYSLSMSSDGLTLVVGAPGYDIVEASDANQGRIYIYNFDSVETSRSNTQNDKRDNSQHFVSKIDGKTTAEQFGFSCSLDQSGRFVAIGAPYHKNIGSVRVYTKDSDDNWNPVGDELSGNEEADFFGASVSLSTNGNQLIVGSPREQTSSQKGGYVKTYELELNKWSRINYLNPILAARDAFGKSLSQSSDGMKLFVGSPAFGKNRGAVRLYIKINKSWTEVGEFIGDDLGDQIGTSVVISQDATKFVVGSSKSALVLEEADVGEKLTILRKFNNNNELFGNFVSIIENGKLITVSSPGTVYSYVQE